jgi:hypothetical protein
VNAGDHPYIFEVGMAIAGDQKFLVADCAICGGYQSAFVEAYAPADVHLSASDTGNENVYGRLSVSHMATATADGGDDVTFDPRVSYCAFGRHPSACVEYGKILSEPLKLPPSVAS